MRRRFTVASAMVGALALMTLAGCTTDPNVAAPSEDAAATEDAVEWFDQELYGTTFAMVGLIAIAAGRGPHGGGPRGRVR